MTSYRSLRVASLAGVIGSLVALQAIAADPPSSKLPNAANPRGATGSEQSLTGKVMHLFDYVNAGDSQSSRYDASARPSTTPGDQARTDGTAGRQPSAQAQSRDAGSSPSQPGGNPSQDSKGYAAGDQHSEPLIFIPSGATPAPTGAAVGAPSPAVVAQSSFYIITFDPSDSAAREAYEKAHSLAAKSGKMGHSAHKGSASASATTQDSSQVAQADATRNPNQNPATRDAGRSSVTTDRATPGSDYGAQHSSMAKVSGRIVDKAGVKVLILSSLSSEAGDLNAPAPRADSGNRSDAK
jgi:hypothetical protein